MGKMDELIKRLCPEGVPMVTLDKVLSVATGKQLNKSAMICGAPYPVVNGGVEYSGYTEKFNSPANSITISQGGASAGYTQWINCDFWAGAHCYVVVPYDNIKKRYLFHVLKENEIRMMESKQGAGIPGLNRKAVYSLEIPLPPLAVQEEIVGILDTFTGMIDNLQKELEQRQKQFEYNCESLVGSAKGEVKTLGEIGRMERGTGLQKSDFRDIGVPCIHYGQIHTYYGTVATETKSFCSEELAKKLRKAKPGDLLIATTSEDVEACCKATVWLGEGEVAYSGDSFKFSHNQNPKYIAYLFKTEAFTKQKRLCATGAKVVRVSGAAMEKFKFRFPSLETQQEIVDKLDTFEALISNIKQEIELRQKQYEFYREKLLTFE